jgi:tyrosyl-tRNA synthetase
VLFGGEVSGLSAAEIEDIFADVPSSTLDKERLSGEGLSLIDLLTDSGVVKSKGEARRAISEGGVYLNNHRVSEAAQTVSLNDLMQGHFIILRRGKKNYHLIKVLA